MGVTGVSEVRPTGSKGGKDEGSERGRERKPELANKGQCDPVSGGRVTKESEGKLAN